MKNVLFLIGISLLFGCSNDLENNSEWTLESVVEGKEFVLDNVIACAASDDSDNLVSVFFYPRTEAFNFKCFVTESVEVDKNDFVNYTELIVPIFNVFNGYLLKFEAQFNKEKWVVVSFEEDGKVHLSNPIRLKHLSKATEYLHENVSIGATSEMPVFTWEDGTHLDTKIYFQVISSSQNDLISGTYTYEKAFQFYNLDNVVLNITREMPSNLQSNTDYTFSLMGVSEDNWVNLFAEKSFEIKN